MIFNNDLLEKISKDRENDWGEFEHVNKEYKEYVIEDDPKGGD